MKEEWKRPEVEEFDIAERTQFDPGAGEDAADPFGGPLGGGGGGGGAPSS